MNDEIKKIIRELKDSIKEHKKEKHSISAGMGMTWEEWDIFFEYFDNLQQENERIKKMNMYEHKYGSDMEEKYLIEKTKNDRAVEYIEKNLLPSHSIEKTDWEFEEVIYSDLPVEVIKPLIDILNGRSDE